MGFGLTATAALVGLLVVLAALAGVAGLVSVAAAVAVAALVIHRPSAGSVSLFAAGVILLDFNPLSVYRYLLLSDVLLLAACGIQFWIAGRLKLYFPALVSLSLAVYVVGLSIGLATAQDFPGVFTWMHFVYLVVVLLPAVTALLVMRPEFRYYLFAGILIAGLVESVIFIAAVASGLEWQIGYRLSGALGTVSVWGYAAAAIALVALMMRGPAVLRLSASLGLVILGVAEMFTRSRMLWVTTVLGSCLFVVAQSRRRIRAVAGLTAVIGLLIAGYLTGAFPEAVERRVSDTLRPTQAGDLVARMYVVHELAPAFERSAALGIGVGQSENVLREAHSPAVVVLVHNLIMHAAVEGGLLAALGLMMLPIGMIVLWRAALRQSCNRAERLLSNWEFSTLLAIYLGAQLTPTLFEQLFYVMLGALAAGAAGSRGARESAYNDYLYRLMNHGAQSSASVGDGRTLGGSRRVPP